MRKEFYLIIILAVFPALLIGQDLILPEDMLVISPDGVEVTSTDNEGRTVTEKPVVEIGNKLFFTAKTDAAGEELWVSELTLATTRMIKDINPGNEGSNPKWLTAVGDKLYFIASTPEYGDELWVSDGTEAGTTLVKDIYPGVTGSSAFALTSYKNKLLFFAMDEESEFDPVIDPSKPEKWLWVSDGTEAGTTRIGRTPTRESDFQGMWGQITPCNGIAFFIGYDHVNNETLWTTDGTEAGTRVLKNVNPRISSGAFETEPANIGWLTAVDDKWVVFRAETVSEITGSADVGNEIWMSDGTEAGTKWIGVDFAKGETNGIPTQSQFALTMAFGDTLFFRADDGVHGVEPCMFVLSKPVVDGVNPRQIWDVNTWNNDLWRPSWAQRFYIYQGDLYFQANGVYFLPESEAPTQQLATAQSLWRMPLTLDACLYQKQIWGMEIREGNKADNCQWFLEVDKKLFFSAQDEDNNMELWVIENRNTAPKRVVDLPGNGKPCQFKNINDNLYFVSEGTKQLFKYELNKYTGIQKSMNDESLTLYPNPATDYISVSSKNEISLITIIDLTGKIRKTTNNPEMIPVSDFSKGVYILTVHFKDNTKSVTKLIIN